MPAMTVSPTGLNLIKSFEGLKLTAYPDPKTTGEMGYAIGYGTTRINGQPVKQGTTITQAQADQYFAEDIRTFSESVNQLLKVPVSQAQFDALVSLAYNIGPGALATSNILKTLNAGGTVTESMFIAWNKAYDAQHQLVVLPALTERRKKEFAVFNGASVPTNTQGTPPPTQGAEQIDLNSIGSLLRNRGNQYNINNLVAARYPQNITNNVEGGSPPWVLFEVRTGRHVLRSGMAEGAQKDGTVTACALYLPPDALQSTQSLNWTSADLGAGIGVAIENYNRKSTYPTAADMSNTTGMADEGIGAKMLNAYGKTILPMILPKEQSVTTEGAALAIAAKEAGQGGMDIVGAMTGQILNPRTDILFKNAAYREHTFTFKLVPRNKTEADNIDAILNIFNYYSLPSYGDAKGAYFIGYPYEFLITMFTQMTGNQHINTIERSVLTSVRVNHAAANEVTFVNQMDNTNFYPQVTELTLNFKEVRLPGRDERLPAMGGGNVVLRGSTLPSGYPAWRTDSGPIMKDQQMADYSGGFAGLLLGGAAGIGAAKDVGSKLDQIAKAAAAARAGKVLLP